MFWLIAVESVLITSEDKANFWLSFWPSMNNGTILLDFLQKTH